VEEAHLQMAPMEVWEQLVKVIMVQLVATRELIEEVPEVEGQVRPDLQEWGSMEEMADKDLQVQLLNLPWFMPLEVEV
jgi:hypothetical protein